MERFKSVNFNYDIEYIDLQAKELKSEKKAG